MSQPLDRTFAQAFAEDWIESWNSHDLERILAHYTGDFEMSSPLIAERMGEPSGTLQGKARVRPYWQRGLEANPDLRFELDFVAVGVSSLSIVYRNQASVRVVEVLFFDDERRVIRGMAQYGQR
jgi:hypothetical protein